jgi:S-adenosylmethionine:tRNA ribosyltransferase-isomerase
MTLSSLPLSPDVLARGLFNPDSTGLQLEDYDYPLDESQIARYPLAQRDASRMLVLNRQTGEVSHHLFSDLPNFLMPQDLMVLNNTRVLPTRFWGRRKGFEATVEVFLLNPVGKDTSTTSQHRETDSLQWSAMMRPSKKMKPGTLIELTGSSTVFEVTEIRAGGNGTVRVHLGSQDESVEALMIQHGTMPIPPYLKRKAEESDKERYQTVFSSVPGAQAAPTAGLHFTPEILNLLETQGVKRAEVTLAVSSGTFRSVKVDDIKTHRMDPEWYECSDAVIRQVDEARQNKKRVLAVGTTVAKTLETVVQQQQTRQIGNQATTPSVSVNVIQAIQGWSSLFIYPGFQFQVVDSLLTNFHLPKSTLLMLVSAFAGRNNTAKAYQEALQENYRFFSYGDCMLII